MPNCKATFHTTVAGVRWTTTATVSRPVRQDALGAPLTCARPTLREPHGQEPEPEPEPKPDGEQSTHVNTTNPTPWPEIKQHVQRVAYVLNGYADAAVQAQTILARRWREKRAQGRVTPGRRNAPPAPFVRADVTKFFTAPETCTASGKLDGTNVGIDTGGHLFGRRTAIPEENQAYQKCPLAELRGRGAQVAALRSTIASAAGMPELEGLPLMLYGELCVNRLYDYESDGAFKSWRIFGVAIQVEQAGDDGETSSGAPADIARRLAIAGFPARCGNTVVLGMCDKLRAIVGDMNRLEPERGRLICVAETGRGSLVEIVDQALSWMLEMRGEGLVLTYVGFGSESVVLGKWKCAQEPQQKNIQLLRQLRHRFSDEGDFPPSLHVLFPPRVIDMVAKMEAVATISVAAAEPVKKAQAAGGAPKKDIVVQEAIASALTKFDSPSAYFRRDQRKEFTALLLEEVVADLKAEGKQKKQVKGAVMRAIGQEFGSWKRAQSTGACAA